MPDRPNHGPIPRTPALLALLGLGALCVVHPVLDLVAKNADFLVVHLIDGPDLVALPVVLVGGLGLILWLPVALAGRRARNALFWSIIFGLLVAGTRPLVGRVVPAAGFVQLALAVGVAAGLVIPTVRRPWWRRHLAASVWAAPAVVAVFLAAPGVRSLVTGGELETGQADSPAPDADTPVVVIVFDAFPVASIMAGNATIDSVLCPNLAELSRDALWFPNALSESDDTLWAVPAILTGRKPLRDSQPTRQFHPDNLLVWLRRNKPVQAFESHTLLDDAHRGSDRVQLWRLTLADLAVIAGHVFLPPDWVTGIPPISHDWKNFAGGADAADPRNRETLMSRFLASLATDEPNSCWFIHALVPHTPYEYMPSGRRYQHDGTEPGGEGLQWGDWSDDLTAVIQSQRRHLLQVGYADAFVGRAMQTLRDRGLYENAVIVVTADHGVAFRRKDGRRGLSPTNAGAILGVPLLIKPPGTGQGRTDLRLARSVDVVPTIAGALGTQPSWSTDGIDLLAKDIPVRDAKIRIVGKVDDLVLDRSDILAQRDDVVARKQRRFGDEPGLPGLFAPLRGAELLGTAPPEGPAPQGVAAGLEGPATIVVPDDPGQPLPAEIRGYTVSAQEWPEEWDVAVTVDGVVAAVTRPRRGGAGNGLAQWATLLPESVLTAGPHDLGVLLVDWRGDEPAVHRTEDTTFSVVGLDLNQTDIPGLVRLGFYPTAGWDGKPSRWTNGRGVIRLPLTTGEPVAAVSVEILDTGSTGGDLLVVANGVPLTAIPLGAGPRRALLDLRGIEPRDMLTLEFLSSTFVPAERMADSRDTRRLGVPLGAVILHAAVEAGDEPLPRPGVADLRPGDPGPWSVAGFFGVTKWDGGDAAWTGNAAQARLDCGATVLPRVMFLDLASTGPCGASLEVTVNGATAFRGELPEGAWSQCIRLPELAAASTIDLALTSTTFVPAEQGTGSDDRRELGVAVRRVFFVF